MTDILVEVPFVAEDVPDPATLTNAQLLAAGRRVADRAWARAQNALAIPGADEAVPYAFGSNVVAVAHRDPARGAKNRWVFAVAPYSGDLQKDAQDAMNTLAAQFGVDATNFTPLRRLDWGPFVFEAARNARP